MNITARFDLKLAIFGFSCVLQRSYVVYPPEEKRPPTAEEFQQIVKEKKATGDSMDVEQ